MCLDLFVQNSKLSALLEIFLVGSLKAISFHSAEDMGLRILCDGSDSFFREAWSPYTLK